ncbi:MAG: tRNA (N6-isopentenyl adenosine(37)-C2)-methylthiotransferase MiaB [Chlamydiales bacterium]|nr:tRNA (N6-isopentenyl adenosine(37)-C2)-methylthiotransferase MiaB [Chlamydiales bacterium]
MADLKKFYIRTYGCQMNENDSEVMAGMLERRGLQRTVDEYDADLLIFNTCSIRDLAERKAMGKLGLLENTKKRDAIIGVTGCMANAKKDSLFLKLPHINFVLGTNNIHQLDAVLDDVLSSGKPTIRTDERFSHELDYVGASREDTIKAHVPIIRGCDKFCTYCVVPYTRGPEVSRSPDEIVEECRRLIDQGYKEFTLLGQNVNSFGKDQPEWNCLFHDLLYRLDALPGMGRIRFMTSHPVDITRELMQAIGSLKSLCDFVHFPLQAGSNRILKKMHRIYTVEQYLEKVQMLRELVPNAALGTDIIVGFPTESDEDFEETYQRMKEIRFSMAFIFTYSPRKGTPAMRWRDDVPEEVKQERHKRLLALQEEIYAEERQAFLGTEVEVLVEKITRHDEKFVKGRTSCWKHVVFPGGPELIGSFQKVKLHSYTKQTMIGDLVS